MSTRVIRTERAPAAIGPYSQALLVDGWLWTCGQIALDPATGELEGADAASQADRALRNLQAILEEAGCGFGDVVRTTLYLQEMAAFVAVNEVYGRYFREPYPARSCIAAARLPRGALVEIDAVARVR